MDQEERIALFLDYENLAIGARDHLGGLSFDLRPVADALAERGRVVVRRAYADWSFFDEDRRMLTRSHVELIDIPQRMGASRKNAADIKMTVDALELAFERDYISTFVLCTGDSDFTPLVDKLRELNKRVIGVGVENSTSRLLPAACDEFLFYDRLEGVEVPVPPARTKQDRPDRPVSPPPAAPPSPRDVDALASLVAQTVAGLQSSSNGTVTASTLKRTLLRKDPTFNEADYGFRAFGELLRHLAGHNVVELGSGSAKGDPEVTLPEHGDREAAFVLLRGVVREEAGADGTVALSGLKNKVRKVAPDFSEKKLGYRSFLQFSKAAATSGAVGLRWSPEADDYLLTATPEG
ncbi:NYN domain-containing protein [Actinoplanes subtropicus]|uniref:NYN domain-containing protein n=1 Tax=Actinoplanes subtropicus TaxID=543632 RepID=UPI0004C42AB7|nr:NYN domain-containing protein [Actinoplanes subtropicus]